MTVVPLTCFDLIGERDIDQVYSKNIGFKRCPRPLASFHWTQIELCESVLRTI